MNQETLLRLAESRNVRSDSRKVTPGDIFVAVDGAVARGSDFIAQAIAAGASHIACSYEAAKRLGERFPGAEFIPWEDTREAIWQLAKRAHGGGKNHPRVIGITGTNGKTTSAWLLEHLLLANSVPAGIIGTINCRWPGHAETASLTTPGPLELHAMLNEMGLAGAKWAVMEVSSHALDQKRAGGVDFSAALFTNLTRDHLDYHHDMEEYFQAKAKLFLETPFLDKPCVINSDDAYGKRLATLASNVWTYGLQPFGDPERHLLGAIIRADISGLHLKMELGAKSWELVSPLVGEFNAMNLLGVQAAALALGFNIGQLQSLSSFSGVRGRLERIANPKNLHVFVDYAHTPDALENAQKALRKAGFKRLVVIFGCGGNRDKTKRPLMGEAVAKYADVAVVTSDNPRFEKPDAIIADILPGLGNARKVIVEADRKKATQMGLSLLGQEDALLIAGKGHEDYQIFGDRKIHYSDQEVALELLL